jgi:phosphate transport system permease protein
VAGSFYTLIVTLLLSFPIGVAAAIYLEEFAPKNRITDVIEVNINNLAAVPSIVFGLLGLAVFLNFFNMPRSAPLVGGLVLSLMTLPTIIIASRVALKSVPPSIRDAALAVGASKMQTIFHHVLPLAMPGMLTGTIIGMARALGETAPLLMIGMVAFIVDIPGGFNDPATVLPVQVFLWADSPERGFVEKTSAAIMILLVFLVVMNATAVYLRNKFEKRW